MRNAHLSALAGAFLLGVSGQSLHAGEIIAGEFSFSDELGGFRILSVSGNGTPDNPFVVVQELSGIRPSILTIKRLNVPEEPINKSGWRIPSGGTQVALRTVTKNKTRKVWVGFDIELQEILHSPSTHSDGLSFDQLGKDERDIRADRFDLVDRQFEPYDRIQFFEGRVNPDMTASFSMRITDVTPRDVFYLVQEPRFLVAQLKYRRRYASARLQVNQLK
ncbi:MAG: hypothetical protein ACR2OJ_14920 [Hyphomicrobiales bacterium]